MTRKRYITIYCKPNGRWHAYFKLGGTSRYLGAFDTQRDAALAWYAQAKRFNREIHPYALEQLALLSIE